MGPKSESTVKCDHININKGDKNDTNFSNVTYVEYI